VKVAEKWCGMADIWQDALLERRVKYIMIDCLRSDPEQSTLVPMTMRSLKAFKSAYECVALEGSGDMQSNDTNTSSRISTPVP